MAPQEGCVRSSLNGDTHATCEVGGAGAEVFAMLTLMKAGIRNVEFKATGAGTGPAGVVVAQSPAAGTMVVPGTGGTLTLKS
jgi:hypothetical protein